MSLYFQETLRSKQLKIYYFITRTQWLFYTVVGILLVLIILIPVTRSLTIFDNIRTVVIIGYIVVSVAVAVLYVITGVQLYQKVTSTLNDRIKKSKKRFLAIRFIVTASCLVMMIIIMIVSRFLRTPATVGIAGSLLICAITAVGIINGVSLLAINSKKPKTATKQTRTATGTQKGETRKDDDSSSSKELKDKKDDDDDDGDNDDGDKDDDDDDDDDDDK